MVQLLNSIYLGAAKPEDYGKAAGVVELLPFDYYLGAAVPGGEQPSFIDVVLSGVSPLVLENAIQLNYLKLFGGTEQRNLPEGYTQLEYLQSNGTQEIRLPFLRTTGHTYKAEFDWEPVSYVNSAGIFSFGADYLGYQISTYTNNGNGIGFANSNYIISSGRTQMTATQSSDGLTVTLTDGVSTITHTRSSANYGYSPSIFSAWTNTRGFVKIYGFKFYEDDVLLFDLIPATYNGINSMYNKVDGSFLPVYAGTLIAGSVIVPSPDTPMDIISNNGVVKASRNLLDKSEFEKHLHWQIITSRNEIQYDADYNWGVSDWIKVTPEQTYTFSTQSNRSGAALFLTDEYGKTSGLVVSGIVPTTAGGTNTYTIPAGYNYIVIQTNPTYFDVDVQIEKGSTATPYTPYSSTGIYTDGTVETIALNGDTATAEMLLKVGNYKDEQSILDGAVTRNVGVRVLDGTESWTASGNLFYVNVATDALEDTHSCYCSHFKGIATNASANYDNEIKVGTNVTQTINWTRVQIYPVIGTYSNVTALKSWLATQYSAGTPVIVLYPLATPTIESVTGQTLTASGNCTAEITQASINNLELEVGYRKRA